MKGLRALAIDYDGTLAQGARPAPIVLEGLAALRATGTRVVLVTGRILSELVADFPDVRNHVDAIVAENGGVLAIGAQGARPLARPVPRELETALARLSVPMRRGQVLLATHAPHDAAVLRSIAELGLDEQIVRNRGELMILPAGVSKGTGIYEALAELGISHHSAIGVGDAENDHALLASCEIGVAVADAVPALKAHADIVLPEAGANGIAKFLDALLHNEIAVTPRRWQVTLGATDEGVPVRIPASQVNVLITGGSNGGKSYVAGLFAERLAQLGYSLCVLDPEGDHTHLGELRGVVTLGGSEEPPSPTQLGRLLQHRLGSLVVDLSLWSAEAREDYTTRALAELARHRQSTGLPHWIVLDEAHVAVGETAARARAIFDAKQEGYCFVTYQPAELCRDVLDALDVVVLLADSDPFIDTLFAAWPSDLRDRLHLAARSLAIGHAVVCRAGSLDPSFEVAKLASRDSAHVRHWHKYVLGHLAPWQHFQFRDEHGRATSRYAANLGEFCRELIHASRGTLQHHARHGDFSRWIGETLQDTRLAEVVRRVEDESRDPLEHELLRGRLVEAVEERYGEDALRATP